MSRCPHCQHKLSLAEVQAGSCPVCGHSWTSPLPGDPALPSDAPQAPVLGDFTEASLPQAISGAGKYGTGLSSSAEPETWNVDGNAVTYDASDLPPAAGDSVFAPQPLELDPDDIERMSIMWGGVDDDVPAGQTIKSMESDEEELLEDHATVDVAELQNAEELNEVFDADESSKTFSPEAAEPEEGKIGDTCVSDEASPEEPAEPAEPVSEKDWVESSISETFLSDELPKPGDAPSLSNQFPSAEQHDTPRESGAESSFDRTFVADVISDEHDSDDLKDEAAKTAPLSGEGAWAESEDSKTFAADVLSHGPRTTEETPSLKADLKGSDTDKTMISDVMPDELYTGSGSADGGRRTDPLASGEVLGADVAEGTGLVIQPRSLQPQEDAGSDKADYQILSVLGEGGMGKVYNARQTSIDRVVAVKMLKAKSSSSRKRDQHVKFLAEAVVTGELDHPNIVPIYDVGRDQSNALFYSMKNVTGNPWLDTIHQKSAHDNLEILMSVADAVAFAHARGVVHRDLKPENVMLGEFGEVLLMDWGLAMPTDKFRKQRGIVRSSSMGGTPAYMAPEMATGPITRIGPHSDIYLLGAILFEIVTGRPPHRGKNAMKCLMSAARNKIVQTEHTGELIDIAYRAMSTDPKDRYKSVQEFQAAVRTYLAHSESITLAAVAEEDLERAQETDNYDDYAKARFGFEEALKLWEGNKRARSSLAAARLAYAHCAMNNGDYDLAGSLLDAGDPTHQKLKADIANARDEREARQKRLEAARRAGRVMLATLFLVVTGAALWINDARAKAVDARKAAVASEKDAIQARDDAEKQKNIAVEAQKLEALLRQEAVDAKKAVEDALEDVKKQQRIAEQRRQQAEAQGVIASINSIMAEEQRTIAEAALLAEQEALASEEKARDEEKRQRELAVQQRQQADAQRVIAGISAIFAEEQATFAKKQEGLAIEAAETAEKEKTKAINAKNEAEKARNLAEDRRQEAVAQEVIASINAIMAEEQRTIAETAVIAEREARVVAQKAKEEEEQEAYVSKVGLASAKIEDNAFDAARTLLEDTNAKFRNWEWGYLMHLCQMHKENFPSTERLETAALIGDGQHFVIAGQNGLAEIRSLTDPARIVKTLPLAGDVTVYDAAVSPDGRLIAFGTDDIKNGFIKLWDRKQGEYVQAKFGSTDVYFDSEQEYNDKHLNHHMDPVVSVQFSQDGSKLLTASLDGSARVWDVSSGGQLVRLFGTNTQGHWGVVWGAAFCPNFEKDSDGNLLRDANGRLVPIPETRIVTVSEDRKALVWVDATGRWRDESKIYPLPAFTAHQGPIYAVACSPDGQYIATASGDHRVLLWRPDDLPQITPEKFYEMEALGQPIPQARYRELVGHDGPVRSVVFGLSAKKDTEELVLLTGSDDNTIKVWNVDRGTPAEKVSAVKTFRGHGGYVRDCVFNPEGTWILSVSHDHTAKQWSLDADAKTEVHLVNGTPLHGHEDNVDAVAFAFTKDGKRIITASRDKTAQVYALDGDNRWRREHIVTEGHTTQIPGGVYFDDGKLLATAGFDNTARVWDVLSGVEKLKLEGTGPTGAIAVSPKTSQGQWILTGSNNPAEFENAPWRAKLWDLAHSEKPLFEFGKHKDQVTAVAFANTVGPKGQILFATADGAGSCSLWRWMPGTAAPVEVKLIQFKERYAHNDRIVSLRFSPDGGRLFTASFDHAVSQWDVARGKRVANWQLTHPKEVSGMDMTADGRWLVTTCFDGNVRLWDVQKAQIARTFRPQGLRASLVANAMLQFDLKRHPNGTLEKAWTLLNPQGDLQKFLQLGGWDAAVKELLTQVSTAKGESRETPRELAEQLARLFKNTTAEDLLSPNIGIAPAISPDGRYLAVANRVDQIVHGWYLPEDPAANAPISEFIIKDGLGDVWAVAFSPAKMRTDLVVLGFSDARQFNLLMYEANQVAAKPSITLDAQGEVASVSVSHDGQYLVTGTRDQVAHVWDVKTARGMAKLHGVHTGPVNAAIFAPKGMSKNAGEYYVLTASDDKTSVLWKLAPSGSNTFNVEVVHQFKGHAGAVTDAAFSPDGSRVVTVSRDQTIRLWDTASGQELARTEPLGGEMLCVAFADDGQRILTGSSNNEAVIWTLIATEAKIQFQKQLLLLGHSAMITDVAFSPLEDLNGDGQISEHEKSGLRAVTASADNSVIVWDTRVTLEGKANQVLTLKRHTRPVKAVQFSPDGRYILTGSEDRQAILWPTKDWMPEKLAELQKNPLEDEKPTDSATVSTK